MTPEQAIELITELVEKAKDLEDPDVDAIVDHGVPPPARLLGEERGAEHDGEAAPRGERLENEHGVGDGDVLEVLVAGLERLSTPSTA